MTYSKNTWKDGDIITAAKINNIEEGLNNIDDKAVTSITVGETQYLPTGGSVQIPAYPSKVSDLQNDRGFITQSTVPSNVNELEGYSNLLNDSQIIVIDKGSSQTSIAFSELRSGRWHYLVGKLGTSDEEYYDKKLVYVNKWISSTDTNNIIYKVYQLHKRTYFTTTDGGLTYTKTNHYAVYMEELNANLKTKTSQLENDKGFITLNDISIPSKTSDLQNDSGFITSADLPEPPTIPTKISDLENDSNFITSAALEGLVKSNELETLITSLGYVKESRVQELINAALANQPGTNQPGTGQPEV